MSPQHAARVVEARRGPFSFCGKGVSPLLVVFVILKKKVHTAHQRHANFFFSMALFAEQGGTPLPQKKTRAEARVGFFVG
jgi:hypothetical protein